MLLNNDELLLSEETDYAKRENYHLRVLQSESQQYLEVMREITQNHEKVSRMRPEFETDYSRI